MAVHPSVARAPAATRPFGLPAPLQWLLFLVLSAVIYAAFFVVPQAIGLKELTPILYFHVPMAWNGMIGLLLAAVYSGLYLKRRDLQWDTKAVAAAELGLLYCVLATVTGAMWARGAWGVWWNWDPKQSAIVVLILLYGAYFALRGSVETRDSRAALSAVYALVAAVTVPLLMHIIPYYIERMGLSLHPYTVTRGEMDPRMLALLLTSSVAFLGLYVWMFRLRVAVGRAEDRREEAE